MKFIHGICWFIITLVLLSWPGSSFPKESAFHIPHLDKIVHVGLFAVLVFLFFRPFLKRNIASKKKKQILFWIAIAGLTYGIVMEFVQKFWIPNRSFDVYDILADGIGCFLPFIFFSKMVKTFSANTA
jgi:VanZ family protein